MMEALIIMETIKQNAELKVLKKIRSLGDLVITSCMLLYLFIDEISLVKFLLFYILGIFIVILNLYFTNKIRYLETGSYLKVNKKNQLILAFIGGPLSLFIINIIYNWIHSDR